MELTDLGLDPELRRQAEAICRPEHRIARVTAVDRGRYLVRNEHSEVPAEATGKLLYSADSVVDMPCVGDWVCVQYHDSGRQAVIHGVVPRKTLLRRKSPGDKIDYQVIAANIDCALIIQSCHFDFNIRRLQRYLVMVRETQIEPVILLSKIDLVDRATAEQMLADVRRLDETLRVLVLSNVTEDGLGDVRNTIQPGKTYCLLGSSGVGKTTLINHLLGEQAFETNTVSGTGEGRHTTTRRQLIWLPSGAMFIDTPGMRELGLLGASEAIDSSFADISELAPQCRFSDCSHTNEPGCAVRAAIEEGALSEDSFRDFEKLSKESEFHEMSYLDRRRKDRAFGRMVKNVKKHKFR